jgi:hypothetical protein
LDDIGRNLPDLGRCFGLVAYEGRKLASRAFDSSEKLWDEDGGRSGAEVS